MLRRLHLIAVCTISMAAFGTTGQTFASVRYNSGAMNYARQMYQQQMKQQAEMQKANDLAEQKAAAAQAAEDKRQLEMSAKASRARRERESRNKEQTIAKRKADNAAKANSTTTVTNSKATTKLPDSKPATTQDP